MNKLETLIAMKDWLQDPEHWNKNYYRYDTEGNFTNNIYEVFNGESIKSTCVVGAAMKVQQDSFLGFEMEEYLNPYAIELGFEGTVHLNDSGTHEAVMKMLDVAIKDLSSENYL